MNYNDIRRLDDVSAVLWANVLPFRSNRFQVPGLKNRSGMTLFVLSSPLHFPSHTVQCVEISFHLKIMRWLKETSADFMGCSKWQYLVSPDHCVCVFYLLDAMWYEKNSFRNVRRYKPGCENRLRKFTPFRGRVDLPCHEHTHLWEDVSSQQVLSFLGQDGASFVPLWKVHNLDRLS